MYIIEIKKEQNHSYLFLTKILESQRRSEYNDIKVKDSQSQRPIILVITQRGSINEV